MKIKILNSTPIILLLITLLTFIINTFHFLSLPESSGDEILFINDLNKIKTFGWIKSIENNISIPYMFITYPLSFIFKNYIALRVINVIILIVTLIYLVKNYNKNRIILIAYLLFHLSTAYHFFSGVNDAIFDSMLIIFIYELYLIISNKKEDFTLGIIALIVAFFTRKIIFMFFPLFLFSFFIYKKNKTRIVINSKLTVGILCFFIIINIPSLIVNNTFSYDLKLPPKHIQSNWNQRQYLSQILINKGKLQPNQHPSWEMTDKYLLEHGNYSLPSSIYMNPFFDIKLTLLEFFKDFFTVFKLSVRQMGLIFIFSLFLAFYQIIYKKDQLFNHFIPITTLLIIMLFCAVIISNVELRWFSPFYIAIILYYFNHQILNKIPINMIILNYVTLILLSFYSIYKHFN